MRSTISHLTDDPDVGGDADPTVTEIFVTPDVAIGDVTVEESAGEAAFVVTLSEPGNRALTFAYETADGSARAGLDYEAASGSVEVAAGEATATILIGDVEYGVAALEEFLDANARGATLALARQLVATKLNLLVGSDPFILPVVEAADVFLAEHPPGSNPKGDARKEALALKDELDAYNNLDCEEDPVIPPGR